MGPKGMTSEGESIEGVIGGGGGVADWETNVKKASKGKDPGCRGVKSMCRAASIAGKERAKKNANHEVESKYENCMAIWESCFK